MRQWGPACVHVQPRAYVLLRHLRLTCVGYNCIQTNENVCVCTSGFARTHKCVSAQKYVCMYTHVRTCTEVRVLMRSEVWIRAFLRACSYLFQRNRFHVCACIYACVVSVCTWAVENACPREDTCVRLHVFVCANPWMHANVRVCVP